jgi:hypothetical protein
MRVASGISIAALARAYGCTWTNIKLIEDSARPSQVREGRYLVALGAIVDGLRQRPGAESDP